jgi:hypothetical protein
VRSVRLFFRASIDFLIIAFVICSARLQPHAPDPAYAAPPGVMLRDLRSIKR